MRGGVFARERIAIRQQHFAEQSPIARVLGDAHAAIERTTQVVTILALQPGQIDPHAHRIGAEIDRTLRAASKLIRSHWNGCRHSPDFTPVAEGGAYKTDPEFN